MRKPGRPTRAPSSLPSGQLLLLSVNQPWSARPRRGQAAAAASGRALEAARVRGGRAAAANFHGNARGATRAGRRAAVAAVAQSQSLAVFAAITQQKPPRGGCLWRRTLPLRRRGCGPVGRPRS